MTQKQLNSPRNVGLCSYSTQDNTKNSIGKEFSAEEIRDIIISNIKNQRYSGFENDDNIISGIKKFCYMYLDDTTVVDEMTIDSLEYSLKYLEALFNKYNALQDSLSVKYYSWPSTELAQTIDEFTLTGDKSAFVYEIIGGKLAKDLTSIIDIVSFCYGIVRLSIKTKKERTKFSTPDND